MMQQHIIVHADELAAQQDKARAVILGLRAACMAADALLHARYPQPGPEERALCEQIVAAVGDSFAVVPEGQPARPKARVAGDDAAPAAAVE